MDSEYGPLSSEPYDPNLAIVEKIITRYDEKDVTGEKLGEAITDNGNSPQSLQKVVVTAPEP